MQIIVKMNFLKKNKWAYITELKPNSSITTEILDTK